MRILVVEDDHKIAGALKRGLIDEKFAVDVQYNGEAGLAMATTEAYDVVVLDRLLPGVNDGVDIIKDMRKQKIHTPVILLTARDALHDRIEGLDSGADDYLVKPFAFEELMARIRALLRRPKDSLGNTLRYQDLMLDTKNFEVRRDERIIKLSGKEFALLEYLMRNPGRVLSKESITAHVWDYDADILPNTIEVYIGYLRNKLGAPNLIHTVRGFGYKFESPDV